MKIAVLIKQVPETDNLKLDEKTGTVIRKGVESIVNPLDLYAIETALRIKDALHTQTELLQRDFTLSQINSVPFPKSLEESQQKATVTVITMGPPDAERSLKEAISMGCDDGILITGREFAGSDTFATSLVISRVLAGKRNNLTFDLILCGERATDGDTGQVGPAVASFLELPIVTYVSRVKIDDNTAEVDRIIEDGIETYGVKLPAVISVSKAVGTPRLPTLSGKKRAKKAEIKIVNFTEELFKKEEVGLKGSPTRVVKIFRPQIKRKPTIITVKKEADIERAADRLIDFITNEINLSQ